MSGRTKGIWKWIGVALLVVISAFGLLSLGGCSAQQVAEAQATAQALTAEVQEWESEFDALKAEYEALAASGKAGSEQAALIAARMEVIGSQIEKGVETVAAINVAVQAAEDEWAMAEGLIGVAAGFFPVLGIALPIVRTARRRFDGVVGAMAEAGGPMNPAVASRAMEPKLKAAVDRARRKIGDTVDRSSGAGAM